MSDPATKVPRVVMEITVVLLDNGEVGIGGVRPIAEDVCIANLMLDRAKDRVKNMKFEIRTIEAPNSEENKTEE